MWHGRAGLRTARVFLLFLLFLSCGCNIVWYTRGPVTRVTVTKGGGGKAVTEVEAAWRALEAGSGQGREYRGFTASFSEAAPVVARERTGGDAQPIARGSATETAIVLRVFCREEIVLTHVVRYSAYKWTARRTRWFLPAKLMELSLCWFSPVFIPLYLLREQQDKADVRYPLLFRFGVATFMLNPFFQFYGTVAEVEPEDEEVFGPSVTDSRFWIELPLAQVEARYAVLCSDRSVLSEGNVKTDSYGCAMVMDRTRQAAWVEVLLPGEGKRLVRIKQP